tara:strand:- start:14166 stop:14405 length:240 start_codon:yes stop_codon:yes gene_type:complete
MKHADKVLLLTYIDIQCNLLIELRDLTDHEDEPKLVVLNQLITVLNLQIKDVEAIYYRSKQDEEDAALQGLADQSRGID